MWMIMDPEDHEGYAFTKVTKVSNLVIHDNGRQPRRLRLTPFEGYKEQILSS